MANNSVTQLRSQFGAQAHPFHMVEPSPWPLLTSFAILSMMVSGVLYFNGIQHAEVLLTLGFLSTLFAMILWFRDITTEGTYLGDHTFAVQKGITMGVALFILSETFFFLSIFWAYFHSSLAPTVELGSHWPPAGIRNMKPFRYSVVKHGIRVRFLPLLLFCLFRLIFHKKRTEGKRELKMGTENYKYK